MSFSESTITTIHNVVTGPKLTRLLLTPVGACMFVLIVVGFTFAGLGFDKLVHIPPLPFHTISTSAGIVLLAAGLLLISWTNLLFVLKKGSPVPFNPPKELIQRGPYKYIRNPMLSGVFFMMFGIGFLLHSISIIFIFTPLLILLHTWELKAIEEPELVKRYGEAYVEYKKRVPMFFPWKRPHYQ